MQRRLGVIHIEISSSSPFIKLSSNFHQTFTKFVIYFFLTCHHDTSQSASGIAHPCQEGNPLPAHAEKEFLWYRPKSLQENIRTWFSCSSPEKGRTTAVMQLEGLVQNAQSEGVRFAGYVTCNVWLCNMQCVAMFGLFPTKPGRWTLPEVCCKISPSSKGSAAHPASDAGWSPLVSS